LADILQVSNVRLTGGLLDSNLQSKSDTHSVPSDDSKQLRYPVREKFKFKGNIRDCSQPADSSVRHTPACAMLMERVNGAVATGTECMVEVSVTVRICALLSVRDSLTVLTDVCSAPNAAPPALSRPKVSPMLDLSLGPASISARHWVPAAVLPLPRVCDTIAQSNILNLFTAAVFPHLNYATVSTVLRSIHLYCARQRQYCKVGSRGSDQCSIHDLE